MKLNKADFLYQNDVRKEILRRADGMDKEDYAIVDELRDDLKSKVGIDTACFQDLRYRVITDTRCIPIIASYIPKFKNIGFAQELVTQQFWRKGNKECSDFLEQWARNLTAENKLTSRVANTLDNAFIKIQDKRKAEFYIELIREKDRFYFTMEMLGKWEIREALSVILERLQKDNVKSSAITALGWYKDQSLLAHIQPFENSGKSGERAAAQKAIKRIRNTHDDGICTEDCQ